MDNRAHFRSYDIDEFDNIFPLHNKTNFSEVSAAKIKETNEYVVLKKYALDFGNKKFDKNTSIIDCIPREIYLNKYLTENTDVTVDMKGICIDQKKKEIYLILERGGISLYNYINENDYTSSDIKRIFYEGLQLIFKLHCHCIMHSDIKVENFIFKNNELKIIDFGLADLLHICPAHSIIGEYLCTVYTKAPEKRKNFETDIYSFGITMVHVITKAYYQPNVKYDGNKITIERDDKIYDETYFVEKIGKDGYNLLCNMLTVDNTMRISAYDALQHPYFNDIKNTNLNLLHSQYDPKYCKINYCLSKLSFYKTKNHAEISHEDDKKIVKRLVNGYYCYNKNEYINNIHELKFRKIHHTIFSPKIIKCNDKIAQSMYDESIETIFKNLSVFANGVDPLLNAMIMFRCMQISDQKTADYTLAVLLRLFDGIINCYGHLSFDEIYETTRYANENALRNVYYKSLEQLLTCDMYLFMPILSYYNMKLLHETNILSNDDDINKFKLKLYEILINTVMNLNIDGMTVDIIVKYCMMLSLCYVFQIGVSDYIRDPLVSFVILDKTTVNKLTTLK